VIGPDVSSEISYIEGYITSGGENSAAMKLTYFQQYLTVALTDNEASSEASNLVLATRDNLQYLREQCLQKGSVISNQVLLECGAGYRTRFQTTLRRQRSL
jgi:hypothetical protein